MFKMYACAALAALPVFVAPAMGATKAERFVSLEIQLLETAVEVLQSDAPPVARAEALSALDDIIDQMKDIKRRIDPVDLDEIEQSLVTNHRVVKLAQTYKRLRQNYVRRNYLGSPELKHALETFHKAFSSL